MDFFSGPWVVIVIFFLLLTVVGHYLYRVEEERTQQLAALAAELGMAFHPTGEEAFESSLADAHFMTYGHTRKIKNLMIGKYGGREIAVFDYWYVTGGGKSRSERTVTVVCLWFNGRPLPAFSVRPEHLGHALGAIFGFQDFDFDHRPAFSERYVLQGEDEARVRAEFHANVFTFFEGAHDLYAEGKGDRFFLYDMTTRPSALELRARMDQALDALDRFRPRDEAQPSAASLTDRAEAIPYTPITEAPAEEAQTLGLFRPR
jgi:hypothetical protein